MESRKFILQKTLIIFLGEVLCVAAMYGIFALLKKLDGSVLLGGAIGAGLGVLNFFFMAVAADRAADQAVEQNVKGGQATIRMSYMLRLVVLFAVLFAFAKSGLCNVFALVLPIVFVRPILTVSEFFRKSGEKL